MSLFQIRKVNRLIRKGWLVVGVYGQVVLFRGGAKMIGIAPSGKITPWGV